MDTKKEGVSRRTFMAAVGAASAALGAASLLKSGRAYAAGSDKIRVGLIGLGGRGIGAGISDCAESSKGVELVAIGDLFQDRLEKAPDDIKSSFKRRKLAVDDIYKVTPEKMFVGWDAYKKVIDSDVDMVILTTPPFFRPIHFQYAVEKGKNVFVEKPIATDPVNVRKFIETADQAKAKNLVVVAGTQMRRARQIMEAVQRIRDGQIGDVVAGQCVRCGDGMMGWGPKVDPARSEMEAQLRRWLFMTWLSGDFVVEQHVHNLDLVNWVMGSAPSQCLATGGREARDAPEYGNIWDHFAAELEYPNGALVGYMGAQIDGVSDRCDQKIVGSNGVCYFDFGSANIKGKNPWKYESESYDPAIREYADMVDAIRNNKPLNEGRQVAESTMTAIMIRMSAYTGRAMKFDWVMNSSKLDLSPEKLELGPYPLEPVAVPGKTPLV